ncbi:MAG TPA: cysteine methyltransferase [Gammaproteobacteria bacterium]|nr:cysteine methyltransferase [Acidiferrobacteraceae bacterium]MDP6397641.1 MGMT family protein [Arenicellales bacterium]HCX86714.1 cysteine methyltransferase [Gammaproteobacteria bacterium]MDP6551471.1 MGMT family protein [Arenicellales bacterium]MDP6790459.1 MGMT family protein [Arenicellales bacterium]
MSGLYRAIYELVKAIPKGQVGTYGQIARLCGCSARQVGYAMAAVSSDDVPWQRVINSRGEISVRSDGNKDTEQYRRLKSEGIVFDSHGRIDLATFQWAGPDGAWWSERHLEPPL